ncbi:MAG: imidazole glycerol phosphate synthase subunit HisH [Nitrococcus mobilis]|nr:imidazole glycerol phosphate synthase subunit HisH [Nitrococcus mobilis]
MIGIAVIDYGMGNLRSMAKALEYVGARSVVVTADAETVAHAERVVFPGQGAVRDCMSALQRSELIDVLGQTAAERPFLGVCMGMQALMSVSEENEGVRALDLLPGSVRHFRHLSTAHQKLKIPHMGWNSLCWVREHPLWEGIEAGAWFYFVHSYYVAPADERLVLAQAEYGATFAAAIGKDNIFATQFHPEKSQQAGLRLLENFIRWDGYARNRY